MKNWQDLVPYKKYRVRYKQQSGNYRWYMFEATWQFIAAQNEPYDAPVKLVWSGRPVCGTQDMNSNYFLAAREVPEDTPCTIPKRIGPMVSGGPKHA